MNVMSDLQVGTHRGLQQCASPSGRFTIMALDHRQNLRRMLHPADPSSATYGELVNFKRIAVRALSDLATGVLLDPEIGAAQCIADGSLPGHVGLVTALEATGYEGPATERRSRLLEGWSASRARNLGASACKLLVYYHPDAANRAAQEALVSEAIRQCRAVDLPIFVETLGYSVTEGTPFAGEDRRRAIVKTASTMSALGADVLKLQFPHGPEVTDRGRWREACAEITSVTQRPWVLLSGDNSPEAFVELAEVACREGASGIACGRGIWTEAPSLPEAEREYFFRTVARDRLQRLYDIVEEHARPWTSAYPPLDADLEGWYRS
jgi:tagatose 1,6-diphosphate aldolase